MDFHKQNQNLSLKLKQNLNLMPDYCIEVFWLEQKRGKKAKKWERARLLHRFLWYVIYGYQGSEPGSQRENGMESSSEPLAVPSEEVSPAAVAVIQSLGFIALRFKKKVF